MLDIYFDDNTMRQALTDLESVADILTKTADNVPENIYAGVGTVPLGQLMQSLLQNAGNLVEISGGFSAKLSQSIEEYKKEDGKTADSLTLKLFEEQD